MGAYLFAILIMAGVFLCGYKIGNWMGWREGFRIAKALERQRRDGISLNDWNEVQGPWDYSPKQ